MMDQNLVRSAHELAITVGRAAGNELRTRMAKTRTIEFKGTVDLVTDADQAAETLIAAEIGRVFPDHVFLGEESSHARGGYEIPADAPVWIVDPLDGTTNYAHGYPHFAVSIAFALGNQVVVGVVYDPTRDEMFECFRGGGARLNGASMSVSSNDSLQHALMATGFAYDHADRAENLRLWEALMPVTRGVRRDGSAALDAAYVAAGRLDGFWERPINPWDIAAGALLTLEAGGNVTSYDGKPYEAFDRELIATNGRIHTALGKVIQSSVAGSVS